MTQLNARSVLSNDINSYAAKKIQNTSTEKTDTPGMSNGVFNGINSYVGVSGNKQVRTNSPIEMGCQLGQTLKKN